MTKFIISQGTIYHVSCHLLVFFSSSHTEFSSKSIDNVCVMKFTSPSSCLPGLVSASRPFLIQTTLDQGICVIPAQRWVMRPPLSENILVNFDDANCRELGRSNRPNWSRKMRTNRCVVFFCAIIDCRSLGESGCSCHRPLLSWITMFGDRFQSNAEARCEQRQLSKTVSRFLRPPPSRPSPLDAR